MVEECCPACRWKGKSLDHHYRWFPDHKPLVTKPLPPPAPASPLPLPKTKMHLWAADIEDKLGWHVANMHLNKFVSIDNVKLAVTMLEDTVKLLAAAVIEAVRRNATAEVTELFSTTSSAVEGLHNVHKTCEIQCQTYLEQVPRRLLGTVADQRKHFAFFSVTSLIIDVLQNDAAARRHILATSADWSSGEYYNKPALRLSSMTDGERFRSSPLARPSAPSDVLRVRVWVDSWNDDMTVRPGHRRRHGS